MRLRSLLIAILLVGGFVYMTSQTRWNPLKMIRPGGGDSERIWSGPNVAQSAALSQDEQNNIEIYQRANRATVNITSTVYRRDWFFQIVPQQGIGSGFVVDADGILRVKANELTTGEEVSVQVRPSHGLSDDEIERMLDADVERQAYRLERAVGEIHAALAQHLQPLSFDPPFDAGDADIVNVDGAEHVSGADALGSPEHRREFLAIRVMGREPGAEDADQDKEQDWQVAL